jgi:hypothetical protein
MSHYMEEVRAAVYDPQTGRATVVVYSSGAELRAARCHLGCLGVVLSVRFRCVPNYLVAEEVTRCSHLTDILALEKRAPLMQFFLIPHLWEYFAQERQALPARTKPTLRQQLRAQFYRWYWLFLIDVGFHLLIKLLAAVLRSPRLVRWYYRRLFPATIAQGFRVVDRSQNALVMEHELFRHYEIEVFVPGGQLPAALNLVREVLDVFAGTATDVSPELRTALEKLGMHAELLKGWGTFTHHYPICVRKVLADDTLISPASSTEEPYYAVSFITYVEPRAPFRALADFLGRSMARLFGARPHWGKYCPLDTEEVERLYPHLDEFRRICRQRDPGGVFRNSFVTRVLGLAK